MANSLHYLMRRGAPVCKRVLQKEIQTMNIDLTNWQTRKLKDSEMAKLYGVSRATIWRWANDGAIPKPQKIGANTTRWDGAEVKASMEQAA